MAVILLPTLAFTGVLLQRNNVAQEEIVETFTVATTRSVAQAVEREISGMITTLRVLARSEALGEGDMRRYHAHAQAALSGTGAHLILIDRQYRQLFNTRVSYGEPLGLMSDPETAKRAFETTDAIVSPVFWGQVAGEYVFNVMMRHDDDISGEQVIILTQNVSNLSNALLSRELPAGWHVALVDGNNNVLAASSHDDTEVGGAFFIPRDGQGTSQRWRTQVINGEEYKTITQRSILTGWYVIAWAPSFVVAQPLRESLLWLIAGGLAIVSLAAMAAAIVARQIARSVRGLARQARRLGSGESIEALQYPVQEMTVVSEVLSEAALKRQKAEAEVRFLMREVAHRSKNQLTVISAMAKQTAQGVDSVEKFIENFQNRIFGLARSTDLLLAHGASGIALRDLFKTQIDPFRPEDPERVKKTGPDIKLNVQAAQVLGMAAHELATNASKYGAFAAPEGRLEVDWSYNEDCTALDLAWREYVPGFAVPQERKGFGTVVLKTMVAGALYADVERVIHEDGLEWRFSIPLQYLDPAREQVGLEGDDEDD
ncbi:sensor histidine kinase [Pelagibacterium lentulum]|uniref:histidine kinase n=1 Tax=Pelagibacterium lentulum TaxID=2029865 RepID=A0A916R7D1_9HYPH|nr:sensor histidine kinase [Pelagibacterium lentulum]GGA38237.1 histidine kinase [Pelagibacterium lentulum]